jgi:hypothetical protein
MVGRVGRNAGGERRRPIAEAVTEPNQEFLILNFSFLIKRSLPPQPTKSPALARVPDFSV